MCIDVVEIWFGSLLGTFLIVFDRVICPQQICFHLWMITLVNINRFSSNFVFALIIWRSALGLLMCKFCQFLTELSAPYMAIFSFLDNNFSK